MTKSVFGQSVTEVINHAKLGPPEESIGKLIDVTNHLSEVLDGCDLGLIEYLISNRYRLIGDCNEAIKRSAKAREYWRQCGYLEYRWSKSLISDAECYQALGQIDSALGAYSRIFELDLRGSYIWDNYTYAVLHTSNLLREQKGDLYTAELILDEFVKSSNFDSVSYAQKGYLMLEQSINAASGISPDRAVGYLNKYKEYRDSIGSGGMDVEHWKAYYNQLGYFNYKIKDYDGAVSAFTKQIALVDEFNVTRLDLRAYNNCSGSLYHLSEFERALFFAKKSYSLLSRCVDCEEYLWVDVIANLVQGLMGVGDVEKAFQYADVAIDSLGDKQSGGRLAHMLLLKAEIHLLESKGADSGMDQVLHYYRLAKDSATEFLKTQDHKQSSYSAISNMSQRLESIRTALKMMADVGFLKNEIDFQKSLLHKSDNNLKLQDHDDEELTTLNYFFDSDSLYVIKEHGDHLEFFSLMDKRGANALIKSCDVSSLSSDVSSCLRRLHEVLIEPLGIDTKKILVLPDGYLSYVPFEMLINVAGFPLVTEYDIVYDLSASVHHSRSDSKMEYSFSMLHPTYREVMVARMSKSDALEHDDSANYLRYSEIEMESIEQSFIVSAYRDDASSRDIETFLETSSVFHFTGHAQDNYLYPGLSYLHLGVQDGKLSGVLTAKQIRSYELQSDLVFLNGCNTGTGKVIFGEGALSLGKSFLDAGAKAVIQSLWSINDKSSADISLAFYQYLSIGYRKSAALRQAKLDYLNNPDVPEYKKHPYYWAGLILIGDDDPIMIRKKNDDRTTYLGLGAFGVVLIGGFWYRQRIAA